jgi:AbrB family transcriptional regulator, transcriptional pleiotropic regulator of transition state genes
MLKSVGIVRKIDELGRVVIPIELRRTLGIKEKDAIEIFVDEEKIVLKKYEPACIFSGELSETVRYKNKMVSKKCIKEMYGLIKSERISR